MRVSVSAGSSSRSSTNVSVTTWLVVAPASTRLVVATITSAPGVAVPDSTSWAVTLLRAADLKISTSTDPPASEMLWAAGLKESRMGSAQPVICWTKFSTPGEGALMDHAKPVALPAVPASCSELVLFSPLSPMLVVVVRLAAGPSAAVNVPS